MRKVKSGYGLLVNECIRSNAAVHGTRYAAVEARVRGYGIDTVLVALGMPRVGVKAVALADSWIITASVPISQHDAAHLRMLTPAEWMQLAGVRTNSTK